MLANLPILSTHVLSMDDAAIEKVRMLETMARELPQLVIPTEHLLHAGMYCRTVHIPAGAMITGALIEIATILIVNGDVTMYANDQANNLTGYNVFAASAHRKQAFVAISDCSISMLFPSTAKSVEEAEEQFTSEGHNLMSRHLSEHNKVVITGEN